MPPLRPRSGSWSSERPRRCRCSHAEPVAGVRWHPWHALPLRKGARSAVTTSAAAWASVVAWGDAQAPGTAEDRYARHSMPHRRRGGDIAADRQLVRRLGTAACTFPTSGLELRSGIRTIVCYVRSLREAKPGMEGEEIVALVSMIELNAVTLAQAMRCVRHGSIPVSGVTWNGPPLDAQNARSITTRRRRLPAQWQPHRPAKAPSLRSCATRSVVCTSEFWCARSIAASKCIVDAGTRRQQALRGR